MIPATRYFRAVTRVICGSLSKTGSVGVTAKRLNLAVPLVKHCLSEAHRISLFSSPYVKRAITNPKKFESAVKQVLGVSKVWAPHSHRNPDYGLIDLSFNEALRLRRVHALYCELRTLQSVADNMGVTRERVRQLLRKGSAAGLFDYETTSRRKVREIQERISRTALIKELRSRRVDDIAKRYGIPKNLLIKLCDVYKLETGELRIERSRQQSLVQYMELVEKMGRHPSTGEMDAQGYRALWSRISRLWSGFDNFRRTYGIPFKSRVAEGTRHGLAAVHERSRQQRNEKMKRFLSVLTEKPGSTVSELCEVLALARPTLYDYIKEQEQCGAVRIHRATRIGQPARLYVVEGKDGSSS